VAIDMPVDLEISNLSRCHLWCNSNAQWECNTLGRNEL